METEFPIPPKGEAMTGHWHCPFCPQAIPVTLYGTRTPGAIKFHDSPAPWADVYAHIFATHPEEAP